MHVLGVPVEVTRDPSCWQGGDHIQLRNEIRVIRQKLSMNVEESYALCMKCGQGIALKV